MSVDSAIVTWESLRSAGGDKRVRRLRRRAEELGVSPKDVELVVNELRGG